MTKKVGLEVVKSAAEFGDNFWCAELAIPWTALGITPKPGLRLGFNLAANNAYQGEKLEWSILTWGRTFCVKNDESILALE